MQKITKILIQYVHTFSCTGELPANMAGIPWPKLSSDLPPTFEAPATPHSFLDCCRSHSTATPSPQYIVITANFFTHPSDKTRFKVNINTDMAVPTVYWRGLLWTAGLPPSSLTSLSFFSLSCRPCRRSATSPPSMAAREYPLRLPITVSSPHKSSYYKLAGG